MPESMHLTNDTYSDISEISGRSLDSKLLRKKVSFNQAVRVKQYPWKPDFEKNCVESIEMPSNRFWFKVYRNEPEKELYSITERSPKINTWTENESKSIHDPLSTIAEATDDCDLYSSGLKWNTNKDYGRYKSQYKDIASNKMNTQLKSPRVGHFESNHFDTVCNFNVEEDRNRNCNDYESNMNLLGHSTYGYYNKIPEELEDNNDNEFIRKIDSTPKAMRLPRLATRRDSTSRFSLRDINTSSTLKNRERSRSHDYHVSDSTPRLRRADKSVSTEELNSNCCSSCSTNRIPKYSHDMATQCFGTLTRGNSASRTINISSFSQKSEERRLNNFKSPTSLQKHFDTDDSSVNFNKQLKKDKEITKPLRPYNYQKKSKLLSPENKSNNQERDEYINGKWRSSNDKNFNQIERRNATRIPNHNGNLCEDLANRANFTILSKNTPINPMRDNHKTDFRNSATVGYNRRRQTPLNEKIFNKNSNYFDQKKTDKMQHISYGDSTSAHTTVPKPYSLFPSILQSKKPTSNLVNSSYLKNSSAKNYSDSNNSIDWSLSGFQLSAKPANGTKALSDSQYTVHRQPSLLMYIPGVSHHDCPALEDDRLSHLSDLSRSELHEGSFLDMNSPSDTKRCRSISVDGKLKWIKWKNKRLK